MLSFFSHVSQMQSGLVRNASYLRDVLVVTYWRWMVVEALAGLVAAPDAERFELQAEFEHR
jgi:hypothetical protein